MSDHDEPAEPQDKTDRLLQSCLERLAAGDTTAKNDLLEVAYARITRRAHQMLGQSPVIRRSYDTGDVVSQACMKLWKSLDAIHPESPRGFAGLVGKMVRQTLIDLYRKCRGPESYDANRATNVFRDADGILRHHVDEVPDAGEDAADSPWERFHAAVEALDEEDKELVHMRWFLGMTHAQIAAQVGCSEKTVLRDWTRIKDTLRRHGGESTGV